jgi:hypothetical protein
LLGLLPLGSSVPLLDFTTSSEKRSAEAGEGELFNISRGGLLMEELTANNKPPIRRTTSSDPVVVRCAGSAANLLTNLLK